MPFALEVEDEDEKEKMKGVTLEDVLRDGVLEQFCGVLHVKLLRAAHLSAKDVNGRSDPFVKLSLGGQLHKSSTKRETLNPVWDEHYDFVVGVAELENNQKPARRWGLGPRRQARVHGSRDPGRQGVIGQIMLLAGQASRVLKLEEELEERPADASTWRLNSTRADNAAKVNEAIEARAEAEVALEHAAKNDESTPSKNEVRDRKMEMMASMSPSRNAPAEHLASGGEDAQDSPGPGGTPSASACVDPRRSVPRWRTPPPRSRTSPRCCRRTRRSLPRVGAGASEGASGSAKKTRAKPPPPGAPTRSRRSRRRAGARALRRLGSWATASREMTRRRRARERAQMGRERGSRRCYVRDSTTRREHVPVLFQASFCGAGEAVVCAFARVRKRAPSRESVGRDARSEYLAFRLVGFENGSVARKKQRLFRSRRFRHTHARDARSLDADTPALAPELALDDPRARST